MFKLVKATAIVSIATITTVFTGLIRAKFTAVTLGPSGVGIYSQAFNFQQFAINVSSLSIGLGITKYVAQYHAQNDGSKIKSIVSSASAMQIAASIALVPLVCIFSDKLSEFLFSSREYKSLLIILSFSILFFVLANAMESILCGFGNYRAFAKGRSIASIVSLVPLFLLIPAMGMRGGFIQLALNGTISFSVCYYLFYKNVPRDISKSIFIVDRTAPNKGNLVQSSRKLLSYGGVMFVTNVLSMGSIVFLRSLLIKYYGATSNGYYQVIFSISAYHVTFFTSGFWAYSYAKLSSLHDKNDYLDEVNDTMRFCLFAVVPFIVALFVTRDFVIRFIFSNKFIYSRELFPTQLFGDMFFLLFNILSVSLLARGRLKVYLGFGVLSSLGFIALFLLLHHALELKAATTAYFIANLLSFLTILYYHIKRMGFVIYARNIKLLFSAIGICIIVLFFGKDKPIIIGSKIILLATWLYFLSTAAEKNKFLNLVIRKTRPLFGMR